MKQLSATLAMANLALLAYLSLAILGGADPLHQWRKTPVGQAVLITLPALGLITVVYFIVDACRREYYESRESAIALAVVGLFSFGVTTIIYFLIWGWQDRHLEFSADFCKTCTQESSEYDKPLDLTTANVVNGGRLVGHSKRCSECGSAVKTHCFYLCGVPVFSRGSFRVQRPATDQVLLRSRDFYWPHLFDMAIVPIFVLGCALALYFM